MMKTLISAAILVAVASVAVADLKSDINASNKKMAETFVKNDFKMFAKLTKEGCTKDFKYIEGGKTMSYDEMLAMRKGSFGSMGKVTKSNVKILSCSEKGSNGSAKLLYTMEMSAKDPKTKKTSITKMVGNVQSTYRKESGKWKMSVMDWKDTKMSVDGKPIDMSKMSGAAGGN